MARILCPVLVGRDAQQAELVAALERARRGAGGVVFVSGPAGIGKSRLLAALGAQARRRRMAVLLGRCVPARVPVPYRPVAEALLDAEAAVGGAGSPAGVQAALGGIVPGWRHAADPAAAESPVVVADALLRGLQALGGEAGCVLLVEDLQWADPETLHAVEYLADHAGRSRVLCVCTLREEPGVPGDAAALSTRLDARRACEVVRVPALADDDVEEMARRSLGVADLDAEVGDALRQGAEGTPFLVEELLAAAVSSGALLRTPEGWRVQGPLGRLVPRSFATTVRARLEELGAAGRRLLGAAALLGRSFDWRPAALAAGMPPAQAARLLEQAVSLQLVGTQEGGFGFRHALTREALLGELLPSERQELAARCLEAVEAAAPSGEEWRHLAADLAQAAGRPDRAAALLLQAGRASLRRGALDTAAAALERGAAAAVDPALRADVLEALAEARSAAGDLRGTRAAAESLLDALAALGSPPGRRGQAHLLVARCAVTAAHFDVGGEELVRARRLAGEAGDAALAARVGAVAAQLAIGEGRPAEAEALARRAAADAEAAGDLSEVVCEALEVASRCARIRDLDEAEAVARQALQVAEDARLPLWRMRALYQLGVAGMFRCGEAEGLQRARQAAEQLGAVATATSLDLEIAAALEAQHRVEETRQVCGRCIAQAQALELRTVEAYAWAFLAVAESTGGARGRMEAAIARAVALAPDDAELLAAVWGDARAVASLAAEDRTRARAELERAVAHYGSPSPVVPRLSTAMMALLAAVEGGDPDFAAAAGITACNAQGAAYLGHARAVLLGRAGRRQEATELAARAGERLSLVPWYRHLVRRLVAEAAIADGWGEPAAWLAEAAEYFDGNGNAKLAAACRALLRRAGVRVARPTRAGRALPENLRRAGVTPREAEVLALLGDGLSNRAVAERLFLSERTVEQHVGLLKQKLGLRTRAQLAVFAAEEARSSA